MKKIITVFALSALFACATTTAEPQLEVPSGAYELDKTHAYITFSYDHLGFSTPQVGFRAFDIDFDLNSVDPTASTVRVTIDTTSIDSRVERFDGHLRGEKFFDTENFPQATFRSTTIEQTGEGTYDVTGDLTIKDVAQQVTMAMAVNKAAMHPMKKKPTIGVTGETKVSRSAFGLDRFVPNVGDEVTIFVTAEFLKSD